MKFTDAMIAGSTIHRFLPGVLSVEHSGHYEGCAIGMGLRAVGSKLISYDEATRQWPWLLTTTTVPCGCALALRPFVYVLNIITHLFDYHVFGARDWTFERFVQWIKSVEPQETRLEATDGSTNGSTDATSDTSVARAAVREETTVEPRGLDLESVGCRVQG